MQIPRITLKQYIISHNYAKRVQSHSRGKRSNTSCPKKMNYLAVQGGPSIQGQSLIIDKMQEIKLFCRKNFKQDYLFAKMEKMLRELTTIFIREIRQERDNHQIINSFIKFSNARHANSSMRPDDHSYCASQVNDQGFKKNSMHLPLQASKFTMSHVSSTSNIFNVPKIQVNSPKTTDRKDKQTTKDMTYYMKDQILQDKIIEDDISNFQPPPKFSKQYLKQSHYEGLNIDLDLQRMRQSAQLHQYPLTPLMLQKQPFSFKNVFGDSKEQSIQLINMTNSTIQKISNPNDQNDISMSILQPDCYLQQNNRYNKENFSSSYLFGQHSHRSIMKKARNLSSSRQQKKGVHYS